MVNRSEPRWQFSPDQVWEELLEQNPWRSTGRVPEELAPAVERSLASLLAQRLQHGTLHRYQLILGPRRVGKTTTMYQSVRHLLQSNVAPDRLWWVRFDHPRLMEVDPGELTRFILSRSGATADNPSYVFFDELTYAEKWDLWLKTFHDERWPVRLAATSSCTAALRNRMLESGVGRWEEQYLPPCLFPEYLRLTGRGVAIPAHETLAATLAACADGPIRIPHLGPDRRRFLLSGGFPELLIERWGRGSKTDESLLLESQRALRADAVERAIYKDIPQAFEIGSAKQLERLLYTLAGQVAQILTPASLCRDLGFSQPTLDRYVSYLERAFLIFILPNYSGNESTVQKRGRKVYFVDSAIRNAALQRGLRPLQDPAEMGKLLENMVASHLVALGEVNQVRVYHWREKEDEVDLIFDHPDRPLAFEVASTRSHHRHGIKAFESRFPRFKRACYLVAPDLTPTRPEQNPDGVGTLPTDLFLLAVGSQLERELTARLAP